MSTVMQDDDVLVQTLVRELTAYLKANPHACDSAEGIARWWLRSGRGVDPAALDSALRVLQARRLIEPVNSIDGRVRYRGVHPGSDRSET